MLLLLLLLVIPRSVDAASNAPPPTLQACDEKVARSNDPRASHCYLEIARGGSISFNEMARHLVRRLARRPEDVHVRLALASVRSAQGHADAEALFREVADHYARQRGALGEVLARTALANLLMTQGRIGDAGESLSRAESVAETSRDPQLIARVRTGQAWLAYRQVDYGRGLRLLASVKEQIAAADTDLRSVWLSTMGANLWAVGRTQEAVETYKEQAALLEAAGNRHDEATARVNIVLLTAGPQRRTLALEAARIAKEGGNLASESSAYFYLSGESPPVEARAHARRSLELAIASRRADQISRTKRTLALFTLPFDRVEAFRLIDEAIAEARGVGDPNEGIRHRFTKANMRWQTGPRAEAIAASLDLLNSIEALRVALPEDELRAQRFDQWKNGYFRLAGHLLAGHLQEDPNSPVAAEDKELAFATLERMRARMLLDRLDVAQASAPRDPDDPSERERDGLRAEIAKVNRRLQSTTIDGARTALVGELETLERQLSDVAARIAKRDPRFGELHQPRLTTIRELRKALAPDEALIAFQIFDLFDRSGKPYGVWVWSITRDAATAYPLPHLRNLWAAVDLFLGLFGRRDGSEAVLSARLYKELLEPVLRPLPEEISKLIIIPDGSLHRLPFDALREDPTSAPVATRYQITLAPSASMWLKWRTATSTGVQRPALVVADPALPGYAATRTAEADTYRVGTGLLPLPQARREGRAIVRALGTSSRMFSGKDATETLIKQQNLADYRVLHFATHAVIDDQHPERTAVLLAPGDDEREDGYLQVREIADLRLSGQLVMLSACQSVGGTVVAGEGALGLAHGFFRAGARAVVATLWPIRDEDAAEAFRLVGLQLGQGSTVAHAVAAARRELIAHDAPASVWAGLVVMGDGELVPLVGGRSLMPSWWMVASFACALFAAGSWTIRVHPARR